MKLKIMFAIAALLLAVGTFAQETLKTCYVQGDSCYTVTYAQATVLSSDCAGKHIVFDRPNRSPRQIPRLGTNPQFGTLKNYTTVAEVYNHLREAYEVNAKGNARELDKLWSAMGYDGFNDPRYTSDKITPVYYNAGVTGMLGAGGNSYVYASISKGQNIQLKAYRITSLNGCDVSIMEICGNAFYPGAESSPAIISKKACKIDLPAGYNPATSSIYSFARDNKCYIRVCQKPETVNGEKAQLVTSLSHNQQFGSMADLKTSEEVFSRLQELYRNNKKGDAAELDKLFKSIGYNGFNDTRFNASQISITRYEGGVAAVMGGGEHQYMYSEISSEQYDGLRGFTIKALNDNCDLTFIDICGNALYCPKPMNCQTFECGCN